MDLENLPSAAQFLLVAAAAAAAAHLWLRSRAAAVEKASEKARDAESRADALKERVSALERELEGRRRAQERSRAHKSRLSRLAHHDYLTGLPNRLLFNDRLVQALAGAKRNRRLTAVMLLDLDNFKCINDVHGHHVGDLVLQEAASRLNSCLRKYDTAARFGGDEFTLLLPEVRSSDDAVEVAQKVLGVLRRPFSCGGHELFITSSVGVAVYPADGAEPQDLLRNADTAMYRAKGRGRNNCQMYTSAMVAGAAQRTSLESSLRKALAGGEFMVYYLPDVDLVSCRTRGMEALLRWRHPEMGFIPPEHFIPLAEKSGLMLQVGEWALWTACEQWVSWREAGLLPVNISVNLSAGQFLQHNLPDRIKAAVDQTGMDPARLELDVTENALMMDVETSARTLRKLKDLGVRVSIDDFGTGSIPFARLKAFPVHALKVDRSFVREMGTGPDGASIDAALVAMAHGMNLKVAAEGVESPEQLNALRSLDYDRAQGYIFSRPLPPDNATGLLASGACLAV